MSEERVHPDENVSAESVEFAISLNERPSMLERVEQRSRQFRPGQRFHHDAHGSGTVVAADPKSGVTINFDNGEAHQYNLASQRKLKPILKDSHTYSAENLFDLIDSDSSGFLDKDEFCYMHNMALESHLAHAAEVAEANRTAAEAQKRASYLKAVAAPQPCPLSLRPSPAPWLSKRLPAVRSSGDSDAYPPPPAIFSVSLQYVHIAGANFGHADTVLAPRRCHWPHNAGSSRVQGHQG